MDDLDHLPDLDALPVRPIVYAPPPRDASSWIQTFTGRQFWPLNPSMFDIDILDIAHALSLVNRYTGHTRFPYSVAQHSVLMHDALVSAGYGRDICLWALLHDATEAYLCDVARPVKRHLPDYVAYEDRLMKCIADLYGLSWPMPDIIKQMDLVMLATERHQLMPGPVLPWQNLDDVQPIPVAIEEWAWLHAKNRFLRAFTNYWPLPTQKAA